MARDVNTEDIEVAERFCGPPGSGNGGYVCGLLARHLSGPVSVRLKAPPPLNTRLRREWTPDSARLLQGSAVIAEARSSTLSWRVPDGPDLQQAGQAAADYPGFKSHLFPRCFVCGPLRAPGDGLRIFPGPVSGPSHGQGLHAAPWTPDASLADGSGRVATEFIWAALDCPSAFAVLPVPEGMAIVLGELCAALEMPLAVGQTTIVTSWPLAHEGRRRTAGTAIRLPDGRLIASARAVWIEVSHSRWAPSS